MDFSSMILRPVLNRITSSIASSSSTSSTNSFIARMLSFTGSFNSRTSLLHEHDDVELGLPTQTEEAGAAYPPPPPPEAPEAAAAPAPASSVTTFDIEAGTTTPLAPTSTAPEGPAAGRDRDEVDAEARRVGKRVLPVCFGVATASLVMFGYLRNKQQPGLLYSAAMAFISLAFFSSLGLAMFFVARPGGGGAAAVARVLKWGMVVAMASVIVSFSMILLLVGI